MIIAFSGVKFAGKDTAAEVLIRSYGFKRIGLADKLKDICSDVFNVPRQHMDDPTMKEAPFTIPVSISSIHVDTLLRTLARDGYAFEFYSTYEILCENFMGKILTSIRDMLQTVGTDICRTFIQDDIWLSYVKTAVKIREVPIVITDARFKNERDYLKSLGAVLVLVKRSGLSNVSSHISENQLGEDSDYDVIVNNSTTVSAMQSDLSMWYTIKYATKDNF
jgi:hypothetical protein